MTGVDALFARAIALEDSGKPEEALEQYRQVLATSPQHADAWHNHGLLLARLGRLAEAEQSHRGYAVRFPDDPRARSNLADVLMALGRYDETLVALEAALRLSPGDASVLVRRGVALACMVRFDESRKAFAEARSLDPQQVARFVGRVAAGGSLETALSPENIFLARRYMAQEQCDWTDWETYVAEMRRAANTPGVPLEPAIGFMALHLPLTDTERHAIMRRIAEFFEAKLPALPAPAPRTRKRIRIGVLSPDFREHLNAYLLRPLFELLDRKRFEILAYSLAPDDGSAARKAIRAAADGFRDLHALPDREAALAIRQDDVDILLDVAGYTTGGRFPIMALRPARVHVNYLGFPSTFGSERIDYAIVDPVIAPSAAGWSESLIRLPSTFFIYDYRAVPAQAHVSRREYGLPEDAFVFCAFHKAVKISPDTFDLWMNILRQVSRSVIWFAGLSLNTASNLRREAAARGVDPSRLVFAPREPGFQPRYVARHRLGDLMLDAVIHNALTSACDALGAGLPLLSLEGSVSTSRVAESVLRAAGVPELVTGSRDEYVRTAVRLASDRAALQDIRDRLQRNRKSGPLFDTAGRVRELEAAFERML